MHNMILDRLPRAAAKFGSARGAAPNRVSLSRVSRFALMSYRCVLYGAMIQSTICVLRGDRHATTQVAHGYQYSVCGVKCYKPTAYTVHCTC